MRIWLTGLRNFMEICIKQLIGMQHVQVESNENFSCYNFKGMEL